MTEITIPREALEAGKDTAFAWLRSFMEDDVRVQQMTDDELTELVSATCIAMLRAWPNVGAIRHKDGRVLDLILPLTENTNDKG